MKRLLAVLLLVAWPAAAQYPTPTFGTTTFMGPANLAPWTTAQRPTSPKTGGIGYNSDTGTIDLWNGTGWANPSVFTGGSVPNATTFAATVTNQGTSALQGSTKIGTDSAATSLTLNGQVNSARSLFWSTASNNVWEAQITNTQTFSGNAGADLRIFSRADTTGAAIGEVVRFTRSNGNVTWNNNNTFTPTYSFHGIVSLPGQFGSQITLMPSGTWTIPAGSFNGVGNSPFLFNASLASGGVVTPTTIPGIINLNISSDTIQFDDASTANQIGDIEIHHTMGGGTYQGQREGLGLQLNFASPTNATSTIIPSLLGLHITTQMTATNAGNVGPAPNTMSLEGADFVVLTSTGSTAGFVNMAGVEVDVQNEGTIVPTFKFGFLSYSGAADTQQGTLGNAAYHTASGVSSAAGDGIGWGCQLCIGKRGTPFPGYAGSTVIGVVPYWGQDGFTAFASPITNRQLNQPIPVAGVEFSRLFFGAAGSGTGKALAVPGFLVDDTGTAFHGSVTMTPTAAGLTLDATLFELATISSVGATTNTAFVNDYGVEETCKVRGFSKVTALSGSNVSTASIAAPSYCATNPASLTYKTQNGAQYALNVTWTAPSVQVITLGGNAASVAHASPVTLKTTVVASLPTCNAGAKGYLMTVTDANAPTYNANAAGGGAITIPVQCDGTNWKTH